MALARLSEINVSTEGVMGAKDFFEAKVLNVCPVICSNINLQSETESKAGLLGIFCVDGNEHVIFCVDRCRLCLWAASLRRRFGRKKRNARDRKRRKKRGKPPSSSCNPPSVHDPPQEAHNNPDMHSQCY